MKKELFSGDCKNENSNGFPGYDDKLTFDENMELYRSYLSEYEKENFDASRQNKYWLTFGTCILYGGLAIILLLFGGLTEYGNQLLFNELYIFIMTYIVGTIIIISILIYKVYSFDFTDTRKKVSLDSLYCPDYWNSILINPSTDSNYDAKEGGRDKKFFGANAKKNDFSLECNIKQTTDNKKTYDILNLLKNNDNSHYQIGKISNEDRLYVELNDTDGPSMTGLSNVNGDYKRFKKIIAPLAGYTYNTDNDTVTKNNDNRLKDTNGLDYEGQTVVPLVCDAVYPLYMAKKDFEYANDNNLHTYNKFRCAYSKACKIPWTDVGCS